MPFRAATWNVLATAYLGHGDYSAVPPELLAPARRTAAVARHAVTLNADLLCLQEVEADVFAVLLAGLGPLGYSGHREAKGQGRPDGCATFHRAGLFTVRAVRRLEYQDRERGERHSGHVALLHALEHEGRLLGVANTHLRWDRPGTLPDEQVGRRQALELVETCRRFEPVCDGWLVCGDFNQPPGTDVVAVFEAAGLTFAHAALPAARSAVANGRARLIDHLFHSAALEAVPLAPPAIDDETVLPSAEQPSDHLALTAEVRWRPA